MISSITGIIKKKSSEFVVVEAGGLGYKVFVPGSTLTALGALGDAAALHTHLHMREDNLSLYGFATEEELSTFELLINVSGVGPKAALSILSSSTVDALRLAIATGNTEMLRRIPGIGAKTAGRIILDLKGKIDLSTVKTPESASIADDSDVLSALVNLGYSPVEAQAAIRSSPQDGTAPVEERIVAALRYFAER
ncbi:MAG: Holliday junction branch migration protein RuvA [Chloroflexi bacterium]|nr:Holliday junction branch migration protein RuvA [Chloroflexota bacterium]